MAGFCCFPTPDGPHRAPPAPFSGVQAASRNLLVPRVTGLASRQMPWSIVLGTKLTRFALVCVSSSSPSPSAPVGFSSSWLNFSEYPLRTISLLHSSSSLALTAGSCTSRSKACSLLFKSSSSPLRAYPRFLRICTLAASARHRLEIIVCRLLAARALVSVSSSCLCSKASKQPLIWCSRVLNSEMARFCVFNRSATPV